MSRGFTDADVLVIARAHGTMVAAAWSGWSRHRVLTLRRAADGYSRGRGHPSKAEIDAMAARPDCGCRRCVDHRLALEDRARRTAVAKHRRITALIAEGRPDDWRADALCVGLPTSVWFPTDTKGQTGAKYVTAKAICDACPVADQCLDAALDAGDIYEGMFGGRLPVERRRLHRQRRKAAG